MRVGVKSTWRFAVAIAASFETRICDFWQLCETTNAASSTRSRGKRR